MMKSTFRISALQWADILVLLVLFVMQNYLTDVWEISLTHAAGIINIWNGISKILPIFFLFLVDEFLGHFRMLVICCIASSVGTSFVVMSTPPVLGSCKKYEKECIGDAQKVIFYIGMALIAAGKAGNAVSVRRFRKEQPKEADKEKSTADELKSPVFLLVVLTLVAIIAAIALPYVKLKRWSIIFGIPAICSLVSTLLFFSGWCDYEKVHEPKGSPITNVCRVFVAFFSKCFKESPRNPTFHKKDDKESISDTGLLRHLEKAALIFPGEKSPEGQVKNKWKLCAISEVEEAKIIVRMVPMWMTFIVCGIVSSIGNTYFIEQANHMNRKIGKWNVPLLVLVLLSKCVKHGLGKLANKLILGELANKCLLNGSSKNSEDSTAPTYPKKNKYLPAIGIGIAMVFSILCCITAAAFERERLRVIKKQGLLEKPDEHIPMSVYWLLFQFFLLAGLDAFGEKSVAAFHSYQGPKSMKHYLGHLSSFMFGLGFICSVLLVYVVGKISERGGKPNWFRFTLNKSRLDRYYWFLAALSSVNLVFFIVVASCYRYDDTKKDEEVQTAEISGAEGVPPDCAFWECFSEICRDKDSTDNVLCLASDPEAERIRQDDNKEAKTEADNRKEGEAPPQDDDEEAEAQAEVDTEVHDANTGAPR